MPIFGEPILRKDDGQRYKEEYNIIGGPNTDQLFEHLKYHTPVTFILANFGTIVAEPYSIQRNHPDAEGRYYVDWIIRCEDTNFKRFKAVYNSGAQKGTAGFEE